MAEKEFKIQNGLRVLEEAYFQSDLDVSGNLIVGNTVITAANFDDIKILNIMGVY